MNINQLVANRIKEIRNDKGITSQAMADDLGITIGSYSAIENGKVNITLERLHQIAHVFKMPLLAFLPSGALAYSVNVSHGEHAINATTYKNYRDKEIIDAINEAIKIMQHITSKMKV